jgi:hypothetical protein
MAQTSTPAYRSPYHERVQALIPRHDPRHVEAYMRLTHPTMDGLSARQFAREAHIAARCVDMDPLGAEQLAQCMGL